MDSPDGINKHIDECFAPIIGKNPRVLVLGTLPSVRSLKEHQYYAHPQNAFWWVMSQLFDFDVGSSYKQRTKIICNQGIAVWDVIQSCHRPGSLDADIDQSSLNPNDFSSLLGSGSSIRLMVFNGQAANKLFQKYVVGKDESFCFSGGQTVMPSTSPANAATSRQEKLEKWRTMLEYF